MPFHTIKLLNWTSRVSIILAIALLSITYFANNENGGTYSAKIPFHMVNLLSEMLSKYKINQENKETLDKSMFDKDAEIGLLKEEMEGLKTKLEDVFSEIRDGRQPQPNPFFDA